MTSSSSNFCEIGSWCAPPHHPYETLARFELLGWLTVFFHNPSRTPVVCACLYNINWQQNNCLIISIRANCYLLLWSSELSSVYRHSLASFLWWFHWESVDCCSAEKQVYRSQNYSYAMLVSLFPGSRDLSRKSLGSETTIWVIEKACWLPSQLTSSQGFSHALRSPTPTRSPEIWKLRCHHTVCWCWHNAHTTILLLHSAPGCFHQEHGYSPVHGIHWVQTGQFQ